MSISWSDADIGVTDDPDRFDEAVRAFRRRVPMTDAEWDALAEDERARAFTVANVAQADLVQEVFDALDSAIENGATLEDFQAEIGEQLAETWGGEAPARIETIFRTNVMGAYTSGANEILSTPEAKEARPFWRYELIDDDRLCPICGDFEDLVLPADDPFWASHIPPLHPNCRCGHPSPLTEDEAHEEGVDVEAPEQEAAPGFGSPAKADDWEPDVSAYDPAIASELERKAS